MYICAMYMHSHMYVCIYACSKDVGYLIIEGFAQSGKPSQCLSFSRLIVYFQSEKPTVDRRTYISAKKEL